MTSPRGPSRSVYSVDALGQAAYADRIYIQNAADVVPRSAFGEVLVANARAATYITFPYHISSGLVITSGTDFPAAVQQSGMAKVFTLASGTSYSTLSSRKVLQYVPGQGARARFTSIFTSGVGAQKQYIGVGDELDGFFFGMSGSTPGVYHRHFNQEDFISQSGWNVRKFNSDDAVQIDFSKGNVYEIKYQWLGFGQIDFAIENPLTGSLETVHSIKYTNTSLYPSLDNPSFPLRVEINNNGEATAATIFTACMEGAVEGPLPDYQTFATSGDASTSADAVHILTIHSKSIFQSKKNRRKAELANISAAVVGNTDVIIEVYKNIAISGTSYADINTSESIIERSTAATLPTLSSSGLLGGFIMARNTSDELQLPRREVEIDPQDTITIVARRINATSSPVTVFLTWRELY